MCVEIRMKYEDRRDVSSSRDFNVSHDEFWRSSKIIARRKSAFFVLVFESRYEIELNISAIIFQRSRLTNCTECRFRDEKYGIQTRRQFGVGSNLPNNEVINQSHPPNWISFSIESEAHNSNDDCWLLIVVKTRYTRHFTSSLDNFQLHASDKDEKIFIKNSSRSLHVSRTHKTIHNQPTKWVNNLPWTSTMMVMSSRQSQEIVQGQPPSTKMLELRGNGPSRDFSCCFCFSEHFALTSQWASACALEYYVAVRFRRCRECFRRLFAINHREGWLSSRCFALKCHLWHRQTKLCWKIEFHVEISGNQEILNVRSLKCESTVQISCFFFVFFSSRDMLKLLIITSNAAETTKKTLMFFKANSRWRKVGSEANNSVNLRYDERAKLMMSSFFPLQFNPEKSLIDFAWPWSYHVYMA